MKQILMFGRSPGKTWLAMQRILAKREARKELKMKASVTDIDYFIKWKRKQIEHAVKYAFIDRREYHIELLKLEWLKLKVEWQKALQSLRKACGMREKR